MPSANAVLLTLLVVACASCKKQIDNEKTQQSGTPSDTPAAEGTNGLNQRDTVSPSPPSTDVASSSIEEGRYTFQSVDAAQYCLDLPSQDASDHDGHVQKMICNGTQYQIWTVRPDPESVGLYIISIPELGDKVLDIMGEGPNDEVRWGPFRKKYHQRWKFEHQGGRHWFVRNAGTNNCMATRTQKQESGEHIAQRTCSPSNYMSMWLLSRV